MNAGIRLFAVMGGGLLLYESFPPRPFWWMAFVALALLTGALRGIGLRHGVLLGLVFGATFLLPLLSWTGTFVGAGPWLALVGIEAAFFAVAGGLLTLMSRLPAAPLWIAAAWVGVEAARARVPFGGFGWGRVGFGQADGPLLSVAALGGVPLLSFCVVAGGAVLAAATRQLAHAVRDRRNPAADLRWPAFLVVLLPVAALLGFAHPPEEDSERVTVALVQGNVPRLGLDFAAQRRAVLDNHLGQTRLLADRVAAGLTPRPDLIIWPENASDLDPLNDPSVRSEIQDVVDAIGAPAVIGAVVRDPGSAGPRNAALLFEPNQGIVDTYDKRRLQPFGETMPLREVLRRATPLVDRVGADFLPGTDPEPLESSVAAVGVATCYEILFDGTVRETVEAGAEILAVPSNNATFGLSDMTYQQLAMSRVRAVEHDRATLVTATSGVSAVVAPDGSVVAATERFEAGLLVAEVPLKSGTTIATAAGGAIEILIIASAVAGALWVLLRRRETGPTTPGGPG